MLLLATLILSAKVRFVETYSEPELISSALVKFNKLSTRILAPRFTRRFVRAIVPPAGLGIVVDNVAKAKLLLSITSSPDSLAGPWKSAVPATTVFAGRDG